MEGRIGKAAVDRRETFRRLTRIAVPFLILAAVADFVENLLSRSAYDVCADGCGVWFAYPLATAALLKYGSFLLVLIPLLYAALAIPRRGSGGAWHVFGRLVLVLRVQVIAVVVFTLALFGPIFAEQGADTIRRWPDEDITDGVAAGVLTLLFALLTLVLSWRLLERDASNGKGVPRQLKPIPLLAICGVGLVLSIAGLVLGEHGSGLLSLGVILVVIAFLSFPVRDAAAPTRVPGKKKATAFPTLLAITPLVVLALALVGAATPQLAYTREGRYLYLLAGALALMVVAWIIYQLLDDAWSPDDVKEPRGTDWARKGGPGWRRFLWATAVVVVVIYAGVALNPWALGGAIGAVGLLVIFLAAVSLFGYAIQHFDHDWRPPQAFTALGFSRMPVVLVLVVWAVLAARMDDGGYHDVRPLTEEQSGAAERGSTTTVETAWTRWLAGQTERIEAAPEPRQAVPLVLVAAEGGGLRAAYWTAHALDCALDGDERSCGYELGGDPAAPETLFALSGASGGSLGLASYVAAFVDGVSDEEWVDDRLGRDFVAPLWASLLYVDIPNSFLKLNLLPDRAEVLERSWEQPWHEEASLFDVPESGGPLGGGLFETYWQRQTPLLLLSGTSVLDGCRVNNSVLVGSVAPVDAKRAPACDSMQPFEQALSERPERPVFTGTYDLGTALCSDKDVRLSTAALLSARFPFVSPSGRVQICGTEHAVFVVDGGYYDNTGASALLELWETLRPLVDEYNSRSNLAFCVVPTFLHLDNHVRTPPQSDPHSRPLELNAPLTAANKIRSGHDGDFRQAAATAFHGPFGPFEHAREGGEEVPRYAYVYPRAEPGADAPLGWALSSSSTDALVHQLAGKNTDVLEDVRRWFSSDLTCA